MKNEPNFFQKKKGNNPRVIVGMGRKNPNEPKHLFPSKKRHNKR
jgi:hypothetical protein